MEQKNVEIGLTAGAVPEAKSLDLKDPEFDPSMSATYRDQFPLHVKIRAEIAYAKAHIVTSDDEETAMKQVDDWVKSQLPRLVGEVIEEVSEQRRARNYES